MMGDGLRMLPSAASWQSFQEPSCLEWLHRGRSGMDEATGWTDLVLVVHPLRAS